MIVREMRLFKAAFDEQLFAGAFAIEDKKPMLWEV
jgi:hypothetical protein